MKIRRFAKTKYFFCLLCTALMLTVLSGCSSVSSSSDKDTQNSQKDSGPISVGNHLTVQNANNSLTLSDNMDTLASDGLYYATWAIGNAAPYENSDGDTVDLYDAQLYLLLAESKSLENAESNMDSWLTAAKTNYDVETEEDITCNGQAYILISYHFINQDNPYARGMSAFGVFDNCAVCIELTCLENFEDDLETILLNFLESCSYS